MGYAEMVDTLKAEDMVQVWREYDFKQIPALIKKKGLHTYTQYTNDDGLSLQVKNKEKMIAFFIPHHAEIQEYGLQVLDHVSL